MCCPNVKITFLYILLILFHMMKTGCCFLCSTVDTLKRYRMNWGGDCSGMNEILQSNTYFKGGDFLCCQRL